MKITISGTWEEVRLAAQIGAAMTHRHDTPVWWRVRGVVTTPRKPGYALPGRSRIGSDLDGSRNPFFAVLNAMSGCHTDMAARTVVLRVEAVR